MANAKKKTEEADVPQFAHLVEKDPTDLHVRFADWLADNTGLDRDEIDEKTVQLACSLRIEFQKSPENQANLEARRAAAEKADEERLARAEERKKKREQAEVEKAAKAEAKKAAAAKPKAAPVAKDEDEAEETPAPRARRRRGAPAKAPVATEEKPAARTVGRRRRGAAKPVAEFDEDDDL